MAIDSMCAHCPRRRLAVALGLPTTDDARRAMASLAGRADVVELRLDLMVEYDLRRLLDHRPLAVIVTNRPLREGGAFAGSEAERARPLIEAVELGAEYVDVEWDAPDLLADLARRRSSATRLIASSHDFAAMPPDLPERRRRLAESGADVAKVVGTARRLLDNLPVFRALEQAAGPTIAIAMGAAGLASRVLALRYDACLLTFAAPDSGHGTAPGQLPLTVLAEAYHAREIGPATVPFGVFSLGRVDQSLIARLNDSARARGRDAVWVPLDARDADEAVAAAREFGKHGFGGYLVAPSAGGAFGPGADRSGEYLGLRLRDGDLDLASRGSAEDVAEAIVSGGI